MTSTSNEEQQPEVRTAANRPSSKPETAPQFGENVLNEPQVLSELVRRQDEEIRFLRKLLVERAAEGQFDRSDRNSRELLPNAAGLSEHHAPTPAEIATLRAFKNLEDKVDATRREVEKAKPAAIQIAEVIGDFYQTFTNPIRLSTVVAAIILWTLFWVPFWGGISVLLWLSMNFSTQMALLAGGVGAALASSAIVIVYVYRARDMQRAFSDAYMKEVLKELVREHAKEEEQ